MRVKEGSQLKYYSAFILGIEKKDKLALLDGKTVDIKSEIIKKYPDAFMKVEDKKDGDK